MSGRNSRSIFSFYTPITSGNEETAQEFSIKKFEAVTCATAECPNSSTFKVSRNLKAICSDIQVTIIYGPWGIPIVFHFELVPCSGYTCCMKIESRCYNTTTHQIEITSSWQWAGTQGECTPPAWTTGTGKFHSGCVPLCE